jgi:phosphonate transport system substrate-binding protein
MYYQFARLALIGVLFSGALVTDANAADPIRFAINEGITYRTAASASKLGYQVIADDLGRVLRRPVEIEIVTDYSKLTQGLAEHRFSLALIHPTHLSLTAVKSGSYTLVSTSAAHTAYRAAFLSKNMRAGLSSDQFALALMNTKQSNSAKPLGVPDPNSITSQLVFATFRELAEKNALTMPIFKHTRFQDSIPQMIDYGFVDVAATASSAIVRDWKSGGGNVVFYTKAVPIKNIIARNFALTLAEIDQVAAYFNGLTSTPDGKVKLERINLPQGFVGFDRGEFEAIAKWLLPKTQ